MQTLKLILLTFTVGKVLLIIAVMAVPMCVELLVESQMEMKKGVSVSHPSSAFIRVVFLGLLSWILLKAQWVYSPVEPFILGIALYFAFFNYAYNQLTRDSKNRKYRWNYLRNHGMDKFFQSWPTLVLLFVQVFVLCLSIYITVHGWKNVLSPYNEYHY